MLNESSERLLPVLGVSKVMRELITVLLFAVFLLSPSAIASFCASERRLFRSRANNNCPAIDRRDPR